MKRMISILISIMLLFSAFMPVYAYAKSSVTIKLTVQQMKSNPGQTIENALKQAHQEATKDTPYVIEVPSGKFKLSRCLHIYSYTTLKCQDDTYFTKTFSDGNMLKAGKQEEVNTGYEGYTNFKIIGGVWDGDLYGNSCAMRFAHCANVIMQNVTIKNVKNAHHMELAAANNFKILSCNFSGYKRTNSGDGEAIQIDVMHNSAHFPSYREFDDTPCKNITVKNCTFDDVYAGVGTRSGVIGSYFEKITINNNTFTNIKDKAICAFNYRNSSIENNTINDATVGVIFEYFPASNVTGKLYMPNSSKADTTIKSDANCVIKNNTITVSNKMGRSNASGVAVYGGIMSKADAKKTGLKAGRYLITKLSVTNNKIISNSASAYGMLLNYVNDSVFSSNSFRCAASVNKGVSGIKLSHASNNSLSSNTVKSFYHGIALIASSKANTLKSNKISKNQQYGIAATKTSGAYVVYGNKIKKNGKGQLSLAKKKYNVLGCSIKLTASKTKKKVSLSWNKIAKADGYRILRSTKKDADYEVIATVKGNANLSYTDINLKKSGKKYYYKIEPYKSAKKSVIYGKQSNQV